MARGLNKSAVIRMLYLEETNFKAKSPGFLAWETEILLLIIHPVLQALDYTLRPGRHLYVFVHNTSESNNAPYTAEKWVLVRKLEMKCMASRSRFGMNGRIAVLMKNHAS